jgi:hypothetical protein
MERSNTTVDADAGTSVREADADHGAVSERPELHGQAGRADRWLAAVLVLLGLALAVNSVAGPLLAGLVSYPFSETLLYQTVGLEAVTLALVVPWTVVAAVLVLRGHPAGALLAVAPSSYSVYMFLQYVLGPAYLVYRPVVLFHLGIFVLSGAVLVLAWQRVRTDALPELSARRERRMGVGLLLLGGFVVFRYLPSFAGMVTGAPLSQEFAADPTMFWSIFLLDLGVVVPVTLATAIALLRGAAWAPSVAYGVSGWYVPVPISVAAMGTVMLVNDDPNVSLGFVAVLSVAAVLFAAFAVWVYRPLFRSDRDVDGA